MSSTNKFGHVFTASNSSTVTELKLEKIKHIVLHMKTNVYQIDESLKHVEKKIENLETELNILKTLCKDEKKN